MHGCPHDNRALLIYAVVFYRGWRDGLQLNYGAFMFSLGRIVATPAALKAIERADVSPMSYVWRHQRLERGELGVEDHETNKRALELGNRIFSKFKLPTGEMILIITEWDRSSTCVMLPEDY